MCKGMATGSFVLEAGVITKYCMLVRSIVCTFTGTYFH